MFYEKQQRGISLDGIVGICCGLLVIPWMIVWYIYSNGNGGDPEQCWVTEGKLTVSDSWYSGADDE